MDWKKNLKVEEDELVSAYESDFFNTQISILFIGSNDVLNPVQINFTDYLINNENIWIKQAIDSILDFYKESYPDYKTGWSLGGLSNIEIEKYLPKEIDSEKLLKLITPSEIYIGSIEKCKKQLFGFGLECEWDIEHGLGMVFQKWKLLDIGGMDVAFDI